MGVGFIENFGQVYGIGWASRRCWRKSHVRVGIASVIHDVHARGHGRIIGTDGDSLEVHIEVGEVEEGLVCIGVQVLVVEGLGVGRQGLVGVRGDGDGGEGTLPLWFFGSEEVIGVVRVYGEQLEVIRECGQV
jgi:hypothetical protein